MAGPVVGLSRCTYPGVLFGFTEWGLVMFTVSKGMATAAGRLFGKRPNALVVSGAGVVSNYESGVRSADGRGSGAVVLTTDAALFVSLIAGGGVTVAVEGDDVVVSSPLGEGRVSGDVVDEPMADPTREPSVLTVRPSKADYAAVYASTSADDAVPVLNAGALMMDAGEVAFVSTDRYRLTDVTVPHDGELDRTVIVPRVLLMVAKSQPVKSTPTLTVGSGDRGDARVWIECDGFTAWAREVEGDYPKVLSLFPKSAEGRFTVRDAKAVAAEVREMGKRVERNTPVRVRVESDGVTFEGGQPDYGFHGRFSAVADVHYGESHATGFNPKFLADILAIGGKGGVTVSQSEPKKSAVFTYEDAPHVRSLLMPVVRF